MFKTLIPFLIMTSLFAGVGGIAGGNTNFQKGSHIHFQKASTWVNVRFSKTLCHDGHDYAALLNRCLVYEREDDGGRKCVRSEKYKAFQELDGQRRRCKKYEDGDCLEWETVRFYQSPKKIVEIKDEDGNIKKRERVIIPKCK